MPHTKIIKTKQNKTNELVTHKNRPPCEESLLLLIPEALCFHDLKLRLHAAAGGPLIWNHETRMEMGIVSKEHWVAHLSPAKTMYSQKSAWRSASGHSRLQCKWCRSRSSASQNVGHSCPALLFSAGIYQVAGKKEFNCRVKAALSMKSHFPLYNFPHIKNLRGTLFKFIAFKCWQKNNFLPLIIFN